MTEEKFEEQNLKENEQPIKSDEELTDKKSASDSEPIEDGQLGSSSESENEPNEIEDEYAEIPEEVLDEQDLEELKEMQEETPKKKERRKPGELTKEEVIEAWEPKTKLGRDVKDRKIKELDEILDKNLKILEPEIVDSLINVQSDLISIGQAKGKFGGGKRRAWRQTQRKTKEGNIPSFSTMAVVGDENGHIGIGSGKSKETLPARDKAIRKAKLRIMKVNRGCSAFDCACSELHTVPFKVIGKTGSIKVELIPAPQGTGLVAGGELKKILKLAGIKDIYSRTSGRKRTTFNLVKACFNALKKTNKKLEGRK